MADPYSGDDRHAWLQVRVARPWAWCWWPAEVPLIDEEPEAPDGNAPLVSDEAVDWAAVLRAVRHAVRQSQAVSAGQRPDSVDVELPMPLTDADHRMVAQWVSQQTAATYRYEDHVIESGQHQLWRTRPHVGHDPVPVAASNLTRFDGRSADPTSRARYLSSLENALTWWHRAAPNIRRANVAHRRQLALDYLEISAPKPLSVAWFNQLHGTDDALLTLAELHSAGRTSPELLTEALPSAWRFKPDHQSVARDLIIDMFRAIAGPAGLTVGGEKARRPGGSLTLFRGAADVNRWGVSWTSDPDVARHFATDRQGAGSVGVVWTARVPSDCCVAFFPDENEFIVDLTGHEDRVLPAPEGAGQDLLTRWKVWRLQRLANQLRRRHSVGSDGL